LFLSGRRKLGATICGGLAASLAGLLTDTPMLAPAAGVLTRHTGTSLIINDLRNNDPAHVPAQTGTNPAHGPRSYKTDVRPLELESLAMQ
jgi:hypothetical protein